MDKQEKKDRFYQLLHAIQHNYPTGNLQCTMGPCSDGCGRTARGSGLYPDCCEKEMAELIGEVCAGNIHAYISSQQIFIRQAIDILEEE